MKRGYDFSVRTYECREDGFATLPSVCNYLQEAASLDAGRMGFSKSDFESEGRDISWVLTRLLVRMERYPAWGDAARVLTWPRGGRRIAAWRDFELLDASGARIGAASSEWMLIDLATRKPVAVPESVFAASDAADGSALGESPFAKFRYPETVPAEGSRPLSLRSRNADIDLNGHVNNVHYIEWMLEPCPCARPREMEIVFRSETFAGDEILVETVREGGFTLHRACSPDGRDHAVARSAWDAPNMV